MNDLINSCNVLLYIFKIFDAVHLMVFLMDDL